MMDQVVCGVILGLFATVAVLLFVLSKRPVKCPKCGLTVSRSGRPQNADQARWGAWTCPQCNSDINSKGNLIIKRVVPSSLQQKGAAGKAPDAEFKRAAQQYFQRLHTASAGKARSEENKMLYLYLLRANQNPTQEIMQQILNQYRLHFGNVTMLGGQHHDGPLPTDPDTSVVSVCLLVCKKKGVNFDSRRDEISYGIDMLAGERIGVCRIQLK
jgi:hypothetical protein